MAIHREYHLLIKATIKISDIVAVKSDSVILPRIYIPTFRFCETEFDDLMPMQLMYE